MKIDTHKSSPINCIDFYRFYRLLSVLINEQFMNSFNILKALCVSGYVKIQRIRSRGLESDGLAGVLGVLMTGKNECFIN